jgi:hypothetical protein
MTTGKLEIKHVFKGNYTKGDVVSYERTGGYVPIMQYEKGKVPESLAKRKALRQKSIDFIFFLKYNLKRNPFDSSLKGGKRNEKLTLALCLIPQACIAGIMTHKKNREGIQLTGLLFIKELIEINLKQMNYDHGHDFKLSVFSKK